jgi:uncharacterized membrane-anchored protein
MASNPKITIDLADCLEPFCEQCSSFSKDEANYVRDRLDLLVANERRAIALSSELRRAHERRLKGFLTMLSELNMKHRI